VNGEGAHEEQKLGVVIVLVSVAWTRPEAEIACIARHLALNPGWKSGLRNPNWVRSDLDRVPPPTDSVVTARPARSRARPS